MIPGIEWKENWLRFAFWGMNGGVFAMCVGSLLPVGLMQTWASVENGYWYARSSEFLGSPVMQTLRWMRVPGDTLFALGAFVLVGFVFSIRSGKKGPKAEVADSPVGVMVAGD
jgi:nitric oxide reductase subunit B